MSVLHSKFVPATATPLSNFPSLDTFSPPSCSKSHFQTHSRLLLPLRAVLPTPPCRAPATLRLHPLLFSRLHSTPPVRTGHKRTEHATPDLWQTFQSSGSFHAAKSRRSPWQHESRSCHLVLEFRDSLRRNIICLLVFSSIAFPNFQFLATKNTLARKIDYFSPLFTAICRDAHFEPSACLDESRDKLDG